MIKRRFGTADTTAIRRFEDLIGYSLPVDYRDYLLEWNGELSENRLIFLSSDAGETLVNIMFGLPSEGSVLTDDLRYESLETLWESEAEYLPDNMLAIGSDGGGVTFCMYLDGPKKGHIYAFEPGALQEMLEDESTKLDLCAEGTYFLAESFTEFMAKLTYAPDEV